MGAYQSSGTQLRRAAAVLREHAEAATAGPWTAYPDGLIWNGDRATDPAAGSQFGENADYIVLMHPPVALALAALLDAEAGLMVATSSAGGHRVEAARALAQAILRGGA